MIDDPTDKPPTEDKTPGSIKKHQPKHTLEMRTPGGSSHRKEIANETVERDRERFSGNRAEKYANIEKPKIAATKDMEAGTRGNLSKEYNKSGKDIER